ncbi:hypothetical protein L211DRAFT_844227 [Terfezia boudieri ATCC MYA-4762]|uniref:Uncharacterized protein n=1 Tax=Terfezia boudieri ATCC MYA-4762 TaxID=1051890 RepID=A0A3N4L4W6_9PEZI|nr:hypothetical protein L211DRAFT_844227 [Terfezia boudieri ATCC MYA-4762]
MRKKTQIAQIARTDASGILSASEFRRLVLAKYRLGLLQNVDPEFLRGCKPSRSQELLTQSLSCYPILESITRQAHCHDIISLMDTSLDIHDAVHPSWHLLWKYTCHWGGTPPTSECSDCRCPICVGCRTEIVYSWYTPKDRCDDTIVVNIRHPKAVNIDSDFERPPRFYCSGCARLVRFPEIHIPRRV